MIYCQLINNGFVEIFIGLLLIGRIIRGLALLSLLNCLGVIKCFCINFSNLRYFLNSFEFLEKLFGSKK